MKIRCPHCETVFRVNPDRIPPSGVRAKCARCGQTFPVMPPQEGAGSAPEAVPSGALPTRAPVPPGTAAAPGTPTPAGASTTPPPPPSTAPPPRPAMGAHETPQPSASPQAAETGRAPSPFGARDPKARAHRLARALVSDIVAYHPDRRERSLADGSIRAEFREEIMKSWEEYVAQVGLDMAKSTPYFRDALNAILASGKQMF